MPGQVTVACKLPHGLILQLFRMEEHDEPQFGGGSKKVKKAVLIDGRRVKLNGFARYKGQDSEHEIRMGAGLTHGVDADFFAQWMKDNADLDAVKKGLIFAQARANEMEAQLKDHRTLKSGLEATDPANLPPEFKGKIATATTAA